MDASANGLSTAVQNTPLEDSILQEDIINKNNNKQEEEKVVLLLEGVGFNNSLIHKFIKNYSLGRIQEVFSQLSKTQSSTNPAGFVRKALEEGYVFDVTKKAAAEKKAISQKQNVLIERHSLRRLLRLTDERATEYVVHHRLYRLVLCRHQRHRQLCLVVRDFFSRFDLFIVRFPPVDFIQRHDRDSFLQLSAFEQRFTGIRGIDDDLVQLTTGDDF